MSSLWPLGVTIYISGTIGEALGANLQRKSLTTEVSRAEEDPSYEQRGKFQQKLWAIGFFLFVFAGIFMSVALFFASQTVLAPLQLFLFVSNAVFANCINKENFRWLGWDGLALLFVVVGVTMSLVSAPKHTESYSNDELMWLMRQPGFIAFCSFAGSFIILVWLTKRRILAFCRNDPRRIQSRWLRTVLNMSYGATAGAFGGVNVTFTKTVFSLIVGQFNNGGIVAVLSSAVLWVFSIVLIGTWFLQIVVTVSGLEVTSAIIVISAHSVTEEVMATCGGILYFQDYLKFAPWTWTVFITGNLIAISSVIGLSHLRLRDAEDKEQQERPQSIAAAEIARKRAISDGFLLAVNHDDICHQKRPSPAAFEGFCAVDEDPEVGNLNVYCRRRMRTW